eukprot:2996672-Pleurochrysis_carterae.AAC.11
MSTKPAFPYNEDGTTGEICTRHFRGGGKGHGPNMMHRWGKKKMGQGEMRERKGMESSIGAELGRYREYIDRLRTFCEKNELGCILFTRSKPPEIGALVRTPDAHILARMVWYGMVLTPLARM